MLRAFDDIGSAESLPRLGRGEQGLDARVAHEHCGVLEDDAIGLDG